MKHRTAAIGAVLTFALSSIGPAAGDQAPPADASAPEITSQEAAVTFSSKVNLVQVPVVVRDAQGRVVGNLKKEDFQLFDKGKLQLITKFSIETTDKAEAKAAPADIPAAGANENAETKPAPATPALPDRYIAYVVDDVHLKSSDLLQARRAMNRHLDEAVDARSRAAIYTTSGKVLADFTDDRAKLHKAVDSILPWTNGPDSEHGCPQVTYYEADYLTNQTTYFSGGFTDTEIANLVLSSSADPLVIRLVREAQRSCSIGGAGGSNMAFTIGQTLAAVPAGINTLPVDQPAVRAARQAVTEALAFGNRETTISLGTLKDIVRRITAMPGSRTLVLASPGFILTRDFRSAEYDVLDSAIRGNVTVNTIDMRGLYTVAGWTSDASQAGPPAAGATVAGLTAQTSISEASQADDVLGELADGTGGKFFHDDNGLKEGLDQLAARPDVLYVLGFSPQDLKYDGTFHALKVKAGNLQGLSLQVRKGYWAPNHAVDPAEQARDEIREAVFSSGDIQDIPLAVQTKFFKSGDQKAELTVTGHLDVSALRFQKAQDRNNDTVTVIAGLFDANGNYISGLERVLNLRLRDQTLAGVRSSGIAVKEVFHVAPGRYVVRMVVRDSEGKTMGARNAGVEIQ